MKNPKLVLLVTFLAFVFSFGLLEYHYSFDPYTWLDPSHGDDFSRGLWLERRNLYAALVVVFFLSFFVTASYLFWNWAMRRLDIAKLK